MVFSEEKFKHLLHDFGSGGHFFSFLSRGQVEMVFLEECGTDKRSDKTESSLGVP